MDLTLTEEQRSFRRLAGDFVDQEIVPHGAAVGPRRAGRPRDRAQARRPRLPRPDHPGGVRRQRRRPLRATCLVLEELGRGDSAVRGIVSVSLGLVGKSITALRHRGAEAAVAAAAVRPARRSAASGSPSPDTGSDAGNLRTKAVRDGDDWLISGSKMFITNGTWADVALVFARTGGPGPRGVTRVPGPHRHARLRPAREINGKLGLRGQATAELSFDDVRVPDSARCSARRARASRSRCPRWPRAGCRSRPAASGSARRCLRRRRRTTPPAGCSSASRSPHHQLVQELIADIAVDVDAARLLTWRVADLIDRGEPFARESLDGQALRLRGRRARRQQRAAGLRRLRLHRRVPGRQATCATPG